MARFFELPYEDAHWAIHTYGWWYHYDVNFHDITFHIKLENDWIWLNGKRTELEDRLKRSEDNTPNQIYKFKADSYDDEYTANGVKELIKEAKKCSKAFTLDGNKRKD